MPSISASIPTVHRAHLPAVEPDLPEVAREADGRWTWLIFTVFTQLRLACPLAADLRPWEKPTPPGRLAPPESVAVSGPPPEGDLSRQSTEALPPRPWRTARTHERPAHPTPLRPHSPHIRRRETESEEAPPRLRRTG